VIGSAHPGGSEAVAWSPSGDRLVSGGVDARVRLWSAGGEPLADLSGHEGTVLSADWSSDGRRIATSGKDGRVIVWDPAQTAMVAGTEAQPQWSRAVEWVVDSRLLVTIEEPGQVAIWSLSEDGDGPTLTELNRFDVGSAPLEFDVSATPAPMLATVHEGGLVQISDLVSGQLVAEPDGVGDSDAVGVDWLAEGAALAVVDLDGSARLWRPDQGGG
jgi:WD40 repeat protein